MRIAAIMLCAFMALSGCAGDMFSHSHACAVRLAVGDGVCSGTVIGPHTILSATHCFDVVLVSVDGEPVRIVRRIDDGNDHTILLTDKTFRDGCRIGKAPTQGEWVYYFGNPGALSDQFRSGRVSGRALNKGRSFTMYDINGWFGDSGAGIFNRGGKLVGVISILYSTSDAQPMHLMGSLPLKFTAQQWRQVQ